MILFFVYNFAFNILLEKWTYINSGTFLEKKQVWWHFMLIFLLIYVLVHILADLSYFLNYYGDFCMVICTREKRPRDSNEKKKH